MAAGALARLMALLRREAPAQAETAREALRRAALTDREHSVVGAADRPIGGSIVSGERSTVNPSRPDANAARSSGRPVFDFHTHPAQSTLFDVTPSADDLSYYSFEYPNFKLFGNPDQELRQLIVSAPWRDVTRAPRMPAQRTGFSFLATDRPDYVLDPRVADDARYELQRAAGRGRFRSVVDDPLFSGYFGEEGDIGDVMSDAAALALLKYRAGQGLGRVEQQLSGAPVGRGGGPQATNAELFRRLEPGMLDLLREKGFARGGLARVKEAAYGC